MHIHVVYFMSILYFSKERKPKSFLQSGRNILKENESYLLLYFRVLKIGAKLYYLNVQLKKNA